MSRRRMSSELEKIMLLRRAKSDEKDPHSIMEHDEQMYKDCTKNDSEEEQDAHFSQREQPHAAPLGPPSTSSSSSSSSRRRGDTLPATDPSALSSSVDIHSSIRTASPIPHVSSSSPILSFSHALVGESTNKAPHSPSWNSNSPSLPPPPPPPPPPSLPPLSLVTGGHLSLSRSTSVSSSSTSSHSKSWNRKNFTMGATTATTSTATATTTTIRNTKPIATGEEERGISTQRHFRMSPSIGQGKKNPLPLQRNSTSSTSSTVNSHRSDDALEEEECSRNGDGDGDKNLFSNRTNPNSTFLNSQNTQEYHMDSMEVSFFQNQPTKKDEFDSKSTRNDWTWDPSPSFLQQDSVNPMMTNTGQSKEVAPTAATTSTTTTTATNTTSSFFQSNFMSEDSFFDSKKNHTFISQDVPEQGHYEDSTNDFFHSDYFSSHNLNTQHDSRHLMEVPQLEQNIHGKDPQKEEEDSESSASTLSSNSYDDHVKYDSNNQFMDDFTTADIVMDSLPIVSAAPSSLPSSTPTTKSTPTSTLLPPALAHPFNGLVILFRTHPNHTSPNAVTNHTSSQWFIDEIDPANQGAMVTSTPILSADLRSALQNSTHTDLAGKIPTAIKQVVSVTIGVHTQQGRARVRLAAVLDLFVLCSSSVPKKDISSAVVTHDVLRIIAIWQIGNNSSFTTSSILLQHVILPPPPQMQLLYDPHSICIADGLLFLGGSVKGFPNIFIARPHLTEPWSLHTISIPLLSIRENRTTNEEEKEPTATRVVALAVTLHPDRKYKYLAVALDNGAMAVMTYDLGMKSSRTSLESSTTRGTVEQPKTDNPNASGLKILVTLQGSRTLLKPGLPYLLEREHVVEDDSGIGNNVHVKQTGDRNINLCTQLTWLPPGPSNMTLPLLAAGFTNGVLIFLVSLTYAQKHEIIQSVKVASIPENESSKKLILLSPFRKKVSPVVKSQDASLESKSTSTIVHILHPISITKIYDCHLPSDVSPYSSTLIAWFDIGSRFLPCIGVISSCGKNRPQIILAYCNAGNTSEPSQLTKLCSGSLPTGHCELSTRCTILTSTALSSVLCHCPNGSLTLFSPSLKFASGQLQTPNHQRLGFLRMTEPVSGATIGITSCGEVPYDRACDFTAHVLSSINVEKYASQADSMEPVGPIRLSMRHWLCITEAGDRTGKVGTDSHRSDELTTCSMSSAGSYCSALYDLSESDTTLRLTPLRITSDRVGLWSSILFTPLFCRLTQKTKVQLVPSSLAFFQPHPSSQCKRKLELYSGRDIAFCSINNSPTIALVLDNNGLLIHEMKHEGKSWNRSRTFRLNFGTNIFIKRLFILKTGVLLFAGVKKCGGTDFLFIGGSCKWHDSGSAMKISLLREPMEFIQFQYGDIFGQLVELNDDERGDTVNISVSTLSEIFIVRVARRKMTILSKVEDSHCGALAPIGNKCVAYFSSTDCAKLIYLSVYKGSEARGHIATIPRPIYGRSHISLLFLRPDRLIYLLSHSVSLSAESLFIKKSDELINTPVPITKPVFLLEPLLSNNLSNEWKNDATNSPLERIIDRFGRNTAVSLHGSDQGIGTYGAGSSIRLIHMLRHNGLHRTVRHLMHGDDDCNGLRADGNRPPPWMPIQSRIHFASSYNEKIESITSGDSQLSEYMGDHNHFCNLPYPSDPSSCISRLCAFDDLKSNRLCDALRFFDFAGDSLSDEIIIYFMFSLQLNRNSRIDNVLEEFVTNPAKSQTLNGGLSLLAALAECLRKSFHNSSDSNYSERMSRKKLGRALASMNQSGDNRFLRSRNLLSSILSNESIYPPCENKVDVDSYDKKWSFKRIGQNNIWNTGPFHDKEKILLLDKIEDWLGRRHPLVLGKEGVEAAVESGERKLVDIVLSAMYDDSSLRNDDDSDGTFREGWIDGVGEGRSDEDNLTLYLRFSEGAEEGTDWYSSGLQDLSQYSNRGLIFGPERIAIKSTTSSVDEGEDGKVKTLYDLVFEGKRDQTTNSCLVIEVTRGSSLDTGILHNDEHSSRQRASLEFWFYVPTRALEREIVLVRRSVRFPGESIRDIFAQSDQSNLLWELALLPSGILEFRTSSGSCLSSHDGSKKDKILNTVDKAEKGYNSDEDASDDDTTGFVSWPRDDGSGGWNHVCLTFCCKPDNSTLSQVSIIMKGSLIASSLLSFEPPNIEPENLVHAECIDDALDRTVLLFGVGADGGFRMTDIRHWACIRDVDDIKRMMYEYLAAAEIRKKLQVKIRNKTERSKLSAPAADQVKRSLPARGKNGSFLLEPPHQSSLRKDSNNAITKVDSITEIDEVHDEMKGEQITFANSFLDIPDTATIDATITDFFSETQLSFIEMNPKKLTVDISESLSKYMRSSAVAAILRGPPATRHFGGNRGGLAQRCSTHEELRAKRGVGSIAICGSEKTVIFSHGHQPSAKTYPIGASGAILSDLVDENESEYLACYLAKDRRVVLIELRSRTVVIELQMTTKMAYWMYLPPVTHGNGLVFMLATPAGGFHWLPLDESPRPRQAWSRGTSLQGKKILAYEEGGSNGMIGKNSRSTIALLSTSISYSGSPLVEAWCVIMFEPSLPPLCMSLDTLGVALFCPTNLAISGESFLPHVVVVTRKTDTLKEMVLDIESLSRNNRGELIKGPRLVSVSIPFDADVNMLEEKTIPEPTLVMGNSPKVICLCHTDYIALVVRSSGFVVWYKFSMDTLSLTLEGTTCLNSYVVDAAIRTVGNSSNEVELVALIYAGDTKDIGYIATIKIKSES